MLLVEISDELEKPEPNRAERLLREFVERLDELKQLVTNAQAN